MGVLLREVLRTLCVVNQWSYAVFWKIGCQNPKLLIWEEYHYDTSSCQMGDRANSLIKKMMVNNQVNVVGEGIIGRAAFTGNHEWILANNYIGDTHPPQVLSEVHLQFSAGMQTIAVIPIFPHGVVQFGSSLAIMENMEFVNNVKSLILQLGCVPGALLSDNYVAEDPTERIGVPVSIGMPVSVPLSGNFKAPNFNPLLADGFSSQAPRIIGQPSLSQTTWIQDGAQSTTSTFQTSNLMKTFAKSHDGQCELKVTPLMKPDDTFRGHVENGVVGAEVMPSSLDAWLEEQAAVCNSRARFSHQPTSGQSDANNGIRASFEQQMFSAGGVRNHVGNNKNALDSLTMPHMRTNGVPILHSHGGYLAPVSDLHNRVSSQIRPTSVSCSLSNPQKVADMDHFSTHLAGVGLQNVDSSRPEEVPLSNLVDQFSATGMLSGGSDRRYNSTDVKPSKNEPTDRKDDMDNELFQTLNIPSTQPHKHMSWGDHIPGNVHNCLKYASGSQSIISANIKYEDSCAQPSSGDDLYDILGVDYKKKLLSSKWNKLLADGPYTRPHIMGKDTSAFLHMQEASSDVYSVTEGLSDSGVFSMTCADHLLDAVVCRSRSASKQCSDDNVSCRTTLTKASGSSVPSGSPNLGCTNMPDQVQRELFNLPKSLEKAGTMASSSFTSGSGKDDMGSCTQTASIYGSQLGSWVEQAHNMRRESSVSTALSKKNDEMSKPNRKRLKPGENPRPRPKDRQMIQDRVKELREIVPNGAKCSIDALLERTIKHMLFLQSVTKHADKLKQTGESKILNKEGGLLLKDNFEGGATWAFEVGSQSMVCPIIVEDLNPPRQMLVEMLCEERGFFLEIADLIRGMGLTILKGLMEARNDKIWARFAVEANRDVTRMEIFMSLVQLLEQTVKGSVSSTNALENNNIMIQHAFPQVASISATGRPSSLQ